MSFEHKFTSVEQYLRKQSGQEKEVILVDHNYVKAWNAHPDSHRTKPARLLFMKAIQRYAILSDNRNEDEVDILSCDETVPSPFDNAKSKLLASECERTLKYNQFFTGNLNKYDPPDINNCTPKQNRLYQDVLKVVYSHRIAKLAFNSTSIETFKLRLISDNSAYLLRDIFGKVCWDSDLLSWLHITIIDNCCFESVVSYISILQALRGLVPTLVDKLLQSHPNSSANETIMQLVKKQFDPVLPVLNQYKTKKLPGNPIILISPSGPNQQMANSQRFHFWHNQLSSLCKVMNVPVYSVDEKCQTTVEDCLDQIMTSLKNKVMELKNHYPNRPVILLGWTIGALIACHVALEEPVAAVICLGFPLTGVNGSRGDLKDPLLESKVPTLFVIGQNANMCSSDDVEDFRARMRAETGLVVVGGADEFLRMSPMKMHFEHVTQSIVDRCILDEISDFLLSVFIKLPPVPAPNMLPLMKSCSPIKEGNSEHLHAEDEGKRRRRKPREFSPEQSPARKRPRHHIPRQSTPVKARLSPSSSETSSSGSCVVEKPSVPKTVKKAPDKRVGRPTAGTWRKRLSTKGLSDINEESSLKRDLNTNTECHNADASPSTTLNSEPKPSVPFPVNILPKKNDPVDVEKAFGRDSSFLPRPLTPPEPEDTVSAEETEKVLAELEAMSDTPVSKSDIVSNVGTPTSGILSQTVAVSERSFLPITEQVVDNPSTTSKSVSIVKSAIPTQDDVKSPSPISVNSGFRTVFQQGKVLPSGSLQNLKSVGISLIGNTQTNSPICNKSTVITVPSPGTATILFSNPTTIRTQPGKMIHLLSKGAVPLNSKTSAVSVSASSTCPNESTDQQVCNLSLLSDVAGMTEPLKETARKVDASSSATLVKLAASDSGQVQSVKCLKVIKSVRAPSPPTRVETPEELVEKQLAIQALNNSIGIETSNNPVKESGYSICYTKADGSIVSHAVTRPGYHPYLSRTTLITTPIRGRGRARPAFTNKPFRAYDT